MAQPEWRGILNQILYVANRYPFTDESVDRIAVDMIGRFQLWCGPAVYHQAISEALQSETALGPPTLRTEHDDTALRDFFRRLRDRLDSGRPWPDARFVRLSTDDWPAFADATAIATIGLTWAQVQERVWQHFAPTLVRHTNSPVLLLRLRTGEAVALIGSYDPDVRRRRTVAMHLLDGDPAAAIASFRELCDLAEEQVTPTPRT